MTVTLSWNYLIVGAGNAGAVLAKQVAATQRKCPEDAMMSSNRPSNEKSRGDGPGDTDRTDSEAEGRTTRLQAKIIQLAQWAVVDAATSARVWSDCLTAAFARTESVRANRFAVVYLWLQIARGPAAALNNLAP